MRIHREGKTTILLTILMVITAIIVFNIIEVQNLAYHIIFYGVLILIVFFILFFFRSPNRKIDRMPDSLLSPADGKIVVVETTMEEEYYKREMVQISIFMSPFHAHVNRYPINGIVDYVKHSPGKYLVAWLPKSSDKNERTSIALSTEKKKSILIRQIAGALARRIVSYSRVGDIVQQGEELGFIKFGSRVDLFLPPEAEIMVKNGDAVRAGKTVIAKI